jgi:ribosomal protein L18E
MPATPARIGFVLEPYRRAVSETVQTKARHGNLARESADPIESWFANLADAQLRADQRQALFSPERRRFEVTVSEIDDVDELLAAQTAITATLVDEERGLAKQMLVTAVTIDLDTQRALFSVWG